MSPSQANDAHEQEHHRAHPAAATPDAVQRTSESLATPSGLHLGDSRLSGRGNSVVRAALAQQVQQTHGNRAVQQMLQRSAARTEQSATPLARDAMRPAEQNMTAGAELTDAPAAQASQTASPAGQATTASPALGGLATESAAPQAVQRSAEHTQSLVAQRVGDGHDQSGNPAAPGKPDLTHDALIEQMAHVMGYADTLSNEQVALLRRHHYTAGPLIAGRNGMQMRVFFSAEPRQASVVCFRGTQPSEWGDIATDFNPDGVGHDQFELNRTVIRQAMESAARSGPAIVTGHSLGGALAQTAASEYPGLVSQVTTFQSPGINRSEAAKLDTYNAAHKRDGRAIDSTHYRVEGDAVPAGGEALTHGTVHNYRMNMGLLGEAERSGGLGLLGLGHYALTAHGALPVTAGALQQGHGNQLPGADPKGLTVTDMGTQSTDEVNGESHYSETARKGVGYIGRGVGTVGHAIGSAGRGIARGAAAVGHGIADGASYTGHAIANGASYVGNAVVNGASAVGNSIAGGVNSIGHSITSGWNSLFGGSESEAEVSNAVQPEAVYGLARTQVEAAVRNGTPEETVRAQIAGMNVDVATRARLLGELAGIYQDAQTRQEAGVANNTQEH